jgi:hypothetical protein
MARAQARVRARAARVVRPHGRGRQAGQDVLGPDAPAPRSLAASLVSRAGFDVGEEGARELCGALRSAAIGSEAGVWTSTTPLG